MKQYLYNYQTIVRFSQPIKQHAVLLRCQPTNNAFQTIEQEHVILSSDYKIKQGLDAFGNRILYGQADAPRMVFGYISTGIVSTCPYLSAYNNENLFLYQQPTPLTNLKQSIQQATIIDRGSPLDKAEQICSQVFEMLQYVPNSTNIQTDASTVFNKRCGVCQDFAHLMIAFCRANNLPARYVNGFVEGEGQTHAWVEVYDGQLWQGFDPTHNRKLQQGYIKLSQGRDAADCPVIRGLFKGLANQETFINVTLQAL